VLDGPELTGRRTAAVTMLAVRTLLPDAPSQALLIGTGSQARHHCAAFHAMFPHCRVHVRGRNRASAEAFCEANRSLNPTLSADDPADAQGARVVVAATTSHTPVYEEASRPDVLVVGVGSFRPESTEIGKRTFAGSQVFVDELAGARKEAGDLLQAGVDWSRVRSLAVALRSPDEFRGAPSVFKSVGCAAWDLAACRLALRSLHGG